MLAIQPQYLTLSKLLTSRLFRIPEYQRAYSWTTEQRMDLFGDISKIYEKGPDEGHFMAAVVCLRREKQVLGTDEYFVVDVVDGQQRLTTLIILLNAIALKLNKDSRQEAKVRNELEELLVKVEADELLLLQTNHDTSHYFSTYLREGSAPSSNKAQTIADREILKAIEECTSFVDQWLEEGEALSSLVALLKNRLFFLFHEIDDEKSVYTVFEVLNSRGLDVSWMDRLKSILMGAAFELPRTNQQGIISDLHTIWRDIYTVIGLRQGLSTEALRFAATLRAKDLPSRPLSEKDSVDALRTEAATAKKIREVSAWLLKVTEGCDSVDAQVRLSAVTRVSQARLLAVALYLRTDIIDSDRDRLLGLWERVSFRIYGMCRKDARTGVGDYVRLAWRITNEQLSVKTIAREISDIGNDFPADEAVEFLRGQDCYENYGNELRYIMFRYEEHLAKEHGQNFSNEQWNKIWLASVSDSIEHIWSQNKAPEKVRNNLGNLVLLPPKLNSRLRDIRPTEKVEAYVNTGLLIAKDAATKITNGVWNARTVREREDRLLKWAKEEWAD